MLNIVLPIAGQGSRFVAAGYKQPKPLIPVHGIPMIEVVINNLRPQQPHHFTFVVLQKHLDDFELHQTLLLLDPDCTIIPVSYVTEGAACTVLQAREIINNDMPLMIANCDQWVDIDINHYLHEIDKAKVGRDIEVDGLIMTMWADHPKWSYVSLNEENQVTQVVEKKVISHDATVGIYNFKRGCDFVDAAEKMISKNQRVNNEFYVAPVYNEMIRLGKNISIYNVGKVGDRMFGIGTPDDLMSFLRHEKSSKVIARLKLN